MDAKTLADLVLSRQEAKRLAETALWYSQAPDLGNRAGEALFEQVDYAIRVAVEEGPEALRVAFEAQEAEPDFWLGVDERLGQA